MDPNSARTILREISKGAVILLISGISWACSTQRAPDGFAYQKDPAWVTASRCDAAAEAYAERENEIIGVAQSGDYDKQAAMTKQLQKDGANLSPTAPSPDQCQAARAQMNETAESAQRDMALTRQQMQEQSRELMLQTTTPIRPDTNQALEWPVPNEDQGIDYVGPDLPPRPSEPDYPQVSGPQSPQPGTPIESMPGWIYTEPGVGTPLNSVPYVGPSEQGYGAPLPIQ